MQSFAHENQLILDDLQQSLPNLSATIFRTFKRLQSKALGFNEEGRFLSFNKLNDLLLSLWRERKGAYELCYRHTNVLHIFRLREYLDIDSCPDIQYTGLIALFSDSWYWFHRLLGLIEPLATQSRQTTPHVARCPFMTYLYLLKLCLAVMIC